MLHDVTLKTLRDGRRAFFWWTLGLNAYVALHVSVYPSVRGNKDLNRMVEQYPAALKGFIAFGGTLDLLSPVGYLGSELYSFMVPLLLLIAAIGAGAGAIAGEEEHGTLELLLAHPITRRRLVFEKLAALVLQVVGLGAVLWTALAVGMPLANMDVPLEHVAAATLDAVLLAVAFGAVTLLLGCSQGHRARAVGIAAALAVGAYVVNSLAPLVSVFHAIRPLSPFYHYTASDPLRHGLALEHAAVLVCIALVAAALATLAFDRRDIT